MFPSYNKLYSIPPKPSKIFIATLVQAAAGVGIDGKEEDGAARHGEEDLRAAGVDGEEDEGAAGCDGEENGRISEDDDWLGHDEI